MKQADSIKQYEEVLLFIDKKLLFLEEKEDDLFDLKEKK